MSSISTLLTRNLQDVFGENDPVRRRAAIDQMFTEEQFECYRALGFHAAFRLFDRDDAFGHLDPDEEPGVAKDLQFLDRLFPRGKPDGEDTAHQKTTFAEWLAAKTADAKAPAKPRSSRGKKGQGGATPIQNV